MHLIQVALIKPIPKESIIEWPSYQCKVIFWAINIVSVKSARAMWKVLMVQNCDNDILEGLAVTDPFQIQNLLFLSWRD
jgi:hypothetical protein